MDEFIERRRSDLAGRTAAILRELADNLDLEKIGRELHRIIGTCGSYGLVEGSQGAADLLARVRNDQVDGLSGELRALADVFDLSASGEAK